MSLEPGLDQHEWLSQYELILDEAETDPENTLVELVHLIEDLHRSEPDEPAYLAAYDLSDRLESGLAVPSEDVTAALEGLKSLFEQLAGSPEED